MLMGGSDTKARARALGARIRVQSRTLEKASMLLYPFVGYSTSLAKLVQYLSQLLLPRLG